MSFKREGDNSALLKNLKNRRVSELLATHIPEDEASLLSNGRYTCIVCKHRPIFDTLDVLAIHRKGKKHLENLSTFLAKREEMKDLIIKRRQDQFLKTGSSNIRIAKTIGNASATEIPKGSDVPALLKEKPYRSRCKKKFKPTDRKIVLDIKLDSNCSTISGDNNTEVSSPSSSMPQTANATVKSYLKSIKRKGSFGELVEKSRNISRFPTKAAVTPTDTANAVYTHRREKSARRCPEARTELQNEPQRRRTDYFLNLRRDGWKKSTDGTWTKDEDAEFDSDEEAPPEYLE